MTPLLSLPDTPAGRVLQQFLGLYNQGDVSSVRSWVADHYADPHADQGPQDDRAVWNSMDYTTCLVKSIEFEPSAGLHLHSIEQSQPHEIGVLVQSGLAGEWLYLKAKVAAEPPHRLIEFRTRPALMPPARGDSTSLNDESLVDNLDTFIGRLADADIFSGTVLVARGGEPIYRRAFGLASREFGVPNRIDTLFNIGSLNKMFTSVAVARLVEQGVLAYEDTVSRYVPEYSHAAETITLHHLLAHLSGVGSYWNEQFESNRVHVRTVQDFLSLFMHEPLAFKPGERWLYSNGGYVLLGAIIERVTGQSYYDVVRELIYRPAGMLHTDAYEVDRPIQNLAVGYTHVNHAGLRELGPHRNNLFMHVIKGGPGGGGFSTVEDLLRFDHALRRHKLLNPALTGLILSGKVELRGSDLQYAYGFFDRQINGRRIVGHSGNFPGIGAQFDMFMESNWTAAILSNVDPAASQIVADHLRDMLTRRVEHRQQR